MSSRSPKLYVDDILQACQDILDFRRGMHNAEELEDTGARSWQLSAAWK